MDTRKKTGPSTGQLTLVAGSGGVTVFSAMTFGFLFANNHITINGVPDLAQTIGGAAAALALAAILYKLTSNNLYNATQQLHAKETALSTFRDWKNTTPSAIVFALFECCIALAFNGANGLKTLSQLSKLDNLIGWIAGTVLTVASGAALVYGFTVRADEKLASDIALREAARALGDGNDGSPYDYTQNPAHQSRLTGASGPSMVSEAQRKGSADQRDLEANAQNPLHQNLLPGADK